MSGSRTAVVIGGASGIGRATVGVLHDNGFRVVIGDVNVDAANEVASGYDSRVEAIGVDVTDETSVQDGLESVGSFHAVVNTAGLSIPGAITDLDLAAWHTTIEVCLTGTFLVLKHAGRLIADGGSAVCIASLNGRQPGAGMASYCSAKAGVLMLVQVAALELAERGVRVNAISPGFVETPLVAGTALVPGLVEEYVENTPLGRVGGPDEIASLAHYLVSDASAWITGSNIEIDGGAHLKRYPDVLGKVRALMGSAG